jgi:DNA-directed RNA polymerase specialized sigma24 family protein
MVQFPGFKCSKQLKQPVGDWFAHKLDIMRFKRTADGILHLLASLKADRAFGQRICGEGAWRAALCHRMIAFPVLGVGAYSGTRRKRAVTHVVGERAGAAKVPPPQRNISLVKYRGQTMLIPTEKGGRMSIAVEISAYLPYLRRFARALTGSSASGDAYVTTTLEIIVADASSFPRMMDSRSALYQVFLKLWSSTDASLAPLPPSILSSTVERNLQTITPMPRQAFLLRAVEGFSLAEIANILSVSFSEVARLIDQAGQEIAEQVVTDVLIIEDEPIIALDIEGIVQDLGHAVTSIARTHHEAVESVKARKPGLVLADIQLADGSSGLEAVNDILNHINVPIIFITAFPERLLTGEKPEPAFLITKPFQADAVKAAISQALFFDRRAGG